MTERESRLVADVMTSDHAQRWANAMFRPMALVLSTQPFLDAEGAMRVVREAAQAGEVSAPMVRAVARDLPAERREEAWALVAQRIGRTVKEAVRLALKTPEEFGGPDPDPEQVARLAEWLDRVAAEGRAAGR